MAYLARCYVARPVVMEIRDSNLNVTPRGSIKRDSLGAREANYSRGIPVASPEQPFSVVAALVILPVEFTKRKHAPCSLREGTGMWGGPS